MRKFTLPLIGALVLAACNSAGPVVDNDPQAQPVEQIAEPSDGIANEV